MQKAAKRVPAELKYIYPLYRKEFLAPGEPQLNLELYQAAVIHLGDYQDAQNPAGALRSGWVDSTPVQGTHPAFRDRVGPMIRGATQRLSDARAALGSRHGRFNKAALAMICKGEQPAKYGFTECRAPKGNPNLANAHARADLFRALDKLRDHYLAAGRYADDEGC